MKKNTILFLLLLPVIALGQQVKLVKGALTENIVINDSLQESITVYLPKVFDASKKWPIVFVFDMEGNGSEALAMFTEAAEQHGYILAASNNTSDTLALSANVVVANRMFNAVYAMLPVKKERIYTAGFSDAARFASVVPLFVKQIRGVVSCGASVGNAEVLSAKSPFYFVGIVGRGDYNFTDMINSRDVLDKLNFPNQLLLFDGKHQWPEKHMLSSALQLLTIEAMTKGHVPKDAEEIQRAYQSQLVAANTLFTNQKPLLAEHLIAEMQRVFDPLVPEDTLNDMQKQVRRSKIFKESKRSQNGYMLKEGFTKEDYNYFLEEDVFTYNYNNLGWWNYQMEELDKLDKSKILFEQQMSSRLRSYLNALLEDTIDAVAANEKQVDAEALTFLYMLKTIAEPDSKEYYLKIVSSSAKVEDYGTALFYLEELLKNGYKDKEELYALEHTAIFRITPEFNALVEKYLDKARYDVAE